MRKQPPIAIRTPDLPTPTLSVDSVIRSLGFNRWARGGKANYEQFRWPPDVFAMAATVLRDSGAYLRAAQCHSYPRGSPYRLEPWLRLVRRVGREWRSRDCLHQDPPEDVKRCLDDVAATATRTPPLRLHDLIEPSPSNFSWLPFLTLMCMAHEACRGIGLGAGPLGLRATLRPTTSQDSTDGNYPFDSYVNMFALQHLILQLLRSQGSHPEELLPVSLCRIVDPSRAIVLPKMRTSQRGITIRSFSHHLALLNGSDVHPVWNPVTKSLFNQGPTAGLLKAIPSAVFEDPSKISTGCGPYNIILLPWPHHIHPSQFRPNNDTLSTLGDRPPDDHRFFEYRPTRIKDAAAFRKQLRALIRNAQNVVGQIHGLVLPELAMSEADFIQVFGSSGIPSGLEFLACGIWRAPSKQGKLGHNYAIVRRKFLEGGKTAPLTIEAIQGKHHRWALDSEQVSTYSLGSALSPGVTWWEGIDLHPRKLHFFALDGFAAFSVLICEDLARSDPVADAVRSVGPNLVICLLMDGPQLISRWSAVLADDPGSSVITLSSLGMVKMSRVRDKLHEQSRVVALWRESGGRPTELHLPHDADALVVSLTTERREERTLDGRSDSGMAGVLRLGGVHPISWR